MSLVTILLVDDSIVREGYHRLLERQEGLHVCAEADDVEQAYRACKEYRPNVVVMDLALSGPRAWHRGAKRVPAGLFEPFGAPLQYSIYATAGATPRHSAL